MLSPMFLFNAISAIVDWDFLFDLWLNEISTLKTWWKSLISCSMYSIWILLHFRSNNDDWTFCLYSVDRKLDIISCFYWNWENFKDARKGKLNDEFFKLVRHIDEDSYHSIFDYQDNSSHHHIQQGKYRQELKVVDTNRVSRRALHLLLLLLFSWCYQPDSRQHSYHQVQ